MAVVCGAEKFMTSLPERILKLAEFDSAEFQRLASIKDLTTEDRELLEFIRGEWNENIRLLPFIRSLAEIIEKQSEALEFYGSSEAMSCRLRSRYEDKPKCLTGDLEYFQDPADLPMLQDGGDKARVAQADTQARLKELGCE